MDRSTRANFIDGFLEAVGYSIQTARPHLTHASHPSCDPSAEVIIIIPHTPESDLADSELATLISDQRAAHPQARIVIALPEGERLRGEAFRARNAAAQSGYAREKSFTNLFDDAFLDSAEDSVFAHKGAGQATGRGQYFREHLRRHEYLADDYFARIRSEVRERNPTGRTYCRRLTQPYTRGYGDAASDVVDADLFDVLATNIGRVPERPTVTFITGQAGAGKSVLFEALATYAYEMFQLEKSTGRVDVSQPPRGRPVPVTPLSVLTTSLTSGSGLYERVAKTQVAKNAPPELLEWAVRMNTAFLMIDGLDEFFAGQNDFFDYINDRLLSVGSSAHVYLFFRDSLLADSAAIRGAVRHFELQDSIAFEIYTLARWQSLAPTRQYAVAFLDKKNPYSQKGGAKVDAFMKAVTASETLTSIVSLPWFTHALLELAQSQLNTDAATTEFAATDEFDIVDKLIVSMVDREWHKLEVGTTIKDAEMNPEWLFIDPSAIQRAESLEWKARRSLRWWLLTFAMQPDYSISMDPSFIEAGALRERATREGIYSLLEEVSHMIRRRSQEDEVSAEKILGLYRKYRPKKLNANAEQRARLIVRQFAFFSSGSKGKIKFADEIIVDQLAARAAVRILRHKKPDLEMAYGDADRLPALHFTRYLTMHVGRDSVLKKHLSAVLKKLGGKGSIAENYFQELLS